MACTTGESIYNLLEKTEEKPAKPPKYVSRFRSTVKDEYKNKKEDYKTMGPAKVSAPTTYDFLKKHGNAVQDDKKTADDFKYPDDSRRPAVPKRDEVPMMGLRTTKNFITTNAVENIMSVPKKPEENYVDTKCGDKHPLQSSGLKPTYVNKKEYGKTPAYLALRKEEMRRAQEEYDAYVAEHFRRGAMRHLTEEDRRFILSGLKENWEELHHQYQGLSVVTDTAPKKNRKERMESEMKALERDIELVEKHRVIYIAN